MRLGHVAIALAHLLLTVQHVNADADAQTCIKDYKIKSKLVPMLFFVSVAYYTVMVVITIFGTQHMWEQYFTGVVIFENFNFCGKKKFVTFSQRTVLKKYFKNTSSVAPTEQHSSGSSSDDGDTTASSPVVTGSNVKTEASHTPGTPTTAGASQATSQPPGSVKPKK